jgi:hypothetical protein
MLLHIQGLMLDLAIGYQLPQGQKLVSKLPLQDPSQPVKTHHREDLRGNRMEIQRPSAAQDLKNPVQSQTK